MKHLDKRVD